MYHITNAEKALLINNAEEIFNERYGKILLYVIVEIFQEIHEAGILVKVDEKGNIDKQTCTALMQFILKGSARTENRKYD